MCFWGQIKEDKSRSFGAEHAGSLVGAFGMNE